MKQDAMQSDIRACQEPRDCLPVAEQRRQTRLSRRRALYAAAVAERREAEQKRGVTMAGRNKLPEQAKPRKQAGWRGL
ncbi:hypothetical protein [Eikenella sp. NML120348]|uniref:hypothetical protein n=1 Tax=Eikenella sp. NML120348 TaxID=1795831 RepID=UPI0007E1BA7B|nr:hypothetical protein [Eikenella sp. NML120348]OAM35754.1 hypothetical protein A7P99_09460 [Eikenella sp. NML120348]